MTRKELGQKIKERRESLGLTQKQLAEKLHTGSSIISRIERAKYSSSFDFISKLLNEINLEINLIELEAKV
mgnify:FL=1